MNYGRFEPLGTIFGLAADMGELWDIVDSEDAINKLSSTIAQNITSKTFWLMLNKTTDAMSNPGRYGWTFAKSLMGSAIPVGVSQFAQALDPELKDPQNIGDIIKARIPGLSQQVEPIRDIWGKPVISPETGAERFLSPFRRSVTTDDPATLEVQRLGIKEYMGNPSDKLGDVRLTREEYQQYVSEAGQLAHDNVIKFLNSRQYQMLNDEQKANAITGIIGNARTKIRSEIKRQHPSSQGLVAY